MNGNERDNLEMVQYINEIQLENVQDMFLNTALLCFRPCVTSFTMSNLDKKETECLERCTKRNMEAFQRITARQTEENIRKGQEMQQNQ